MNDRALRLKLQEAIETQRAVIIESSHVDENTREETNQRLTAYESLFIRPEDRPTPLDINMSLNGPTLTKGLGKITSFVGVLNNVANGDADLYQEFLKAVTAVLPHPVSVDELLKFKATIFTGIDVPTEGFDGNTVIERLRSTGFEKWYNGKPRRDWVWVRQQAQATPGRPLPYFALHGRLPFQLQRIFKLCVDHNGASTIMHLAFVMVTRPINGGRASNVTGMVRVELPKSGSIYRVIDAGAIAGAAHLIPETPNAARVIPNKTWVVNSHIDLKTWNDVYYMEEDDLDKSLAGTWKGRGGKRRAVVELGDDVELTGKPSEGASID